jgi:prepilin-type N-terminal cleavage/methylation domain-containing protein
MRLLNVRRFSNERGFTLAEILTALVITGILSALVGANLLAWVNRNKVQQVAESVQGALQDAQRQAIRLGRHCQVELSNTDDSPPAGVFNHLTATQAGAPTSRCFVATDASRVPFLPNGIRMRTNIPSPPGTPPRIEFSFRGHVSQPTFGAVAADFPTIVIYATPDNSGQDYPNQQRRCVVIASLLGAIRMGVYTGDLSSIDANRCETNLEGTRS